MDLNKLLQQAQDMQAKMLETQQTLGDISVQGTAGGGMVRVTATGKQELTEVVIDKSCVDPNDVDILQDLVLAAVNDALRQARSVAEQKMAGVTGGLKFPGM